MPATTTARLPADEREFALDDFLARSLKGQWRSYRKEFIRCQKEFSEDAVHKVRIAIRRLLATLGLLASVLTSEDVHPAGHRLKNRLRTFARLRDTHAQLIYVRTLRRKFPAARHLKDFASIPPTRVPKSRAGNQGNP